MTAPYPPETLARIALALERIADALTPAPDAAPPRRARPPAAPGVAGHLSDYRPFENSRYSRGR